MAKSNENNAKSSIILLDKFSADDIEKWKAVHEQLFDYYWSEYSYYANERSKVASKIRKALLSGCTPYEFTSWFRIVPYQYTNAPLSAAGSRLNINGGRFNIGQIDPSKFPVFSSLYIASDHETAMAEKFSSKDKDKEGLEREAFGGVITSHSSVRVSGRLETVLDTTKLAKLKPFTDVIKKISTPKKLINSAKKLKIATPDNIRTPTQLRNAIRDHNWAANPSMLNIPSVSQIFGQIVHDAGIQAILYQSKHTEKSCLAIFPSNFQDEAGHISIDDHSPDIVVKRLDKKSWNTLA